jgi:hypothetical protein
VLVAVALGHGGIGGRGPAIWVVRVGDGVGSSGEGGAVGATVAVNVIGGVGRSVGGGVGSTVGGTVSVGGADAVSVGTGDADTDGTGDADSVPAGGVGPGTPPPPAPTTPGGSSGPAPTWPVPWRWAAPSEPAPTPGRKLFGHNRASAANAIAPRATRAAMASRIRSVTGAGSPSAVPQPIL